MDRSRDLGRVTVASHPSVQQTRYGHAADAIGAAGRTARANQVRFNNNPKTVKEQTSSFDR
jgi:hypothetical protein